MSKRPSSPTVQKPASDGARKRTQATGNRSDSKVAKTSDDRQFVTALARGLQLLRAFQPGDTALSNSELARRTGLARPTITRFAYTLSRLGYLFASEGGYRLSPSVLTLGYPVLASFEIREVAGRHMQALANHAEGTVALGTRVGNEIVFIHRCIGPAPVGLQLEVGSAIPIATTAMGRAWIAGAPLHEREEILQGLPAAYGRNAAKVKAGIVESLEVYGKTGFCISVGAWQSDVSAVGVPLRVGPNGPSFAFNCGGPSYRLPPERLMKDIGPRLVALAADVRKILEGGRIMQNG